jgi:elongation factor P--(R)-beta-lysine ligase
MKTWQKIKANPGLLEKYVVREKVIDAIRGYFKQRGFNEVFTPILVPVPSCEPNLEPYKTQLRTASGEKRDAYLIMSPEYAHKKLIAAGMKNIFEITRSFRNEEEVSTAHNPEFTILEWYRTQADYKKIMEDFENLFVEIIGKRTLKHQGEEYDISLPWPRISFEEAFTKYANKKIEEVRDEDFYQGFFNEIEPRLRESHRPAFVYDYPASQASLARKKAKDPRFAERFEVFLAGMELGNAFSELTDAGEQQARFSKELKQRKTEGKTEYGMDADFIEALKSGMPKTAGMAVGVDRLVMLAADTATIGETMFFPGGEMFDLGDQRR